VTAPYDFAVLLLTFEFNHSPLSGLEGVLITALLKFGNTILQNAEPCMSSLEAPLLRFRRDLIRTRIGLGECVVVPGEQFADDAALRTQFQVRDLLKVV
jgi:hypothetical protein